MGRRYTDEDVARWYERYQAGLTLKEIVSECGASEPTILGEFIRRGLPRRPAYRRPGPLAKARAVPAAATTDPGPQPERSVASTNAARPRSSRSRP
jgi:hypothetical protein